MRAPWHMPTGCPPITAVAFEPGLSALEPPTRATMPAPPVFVEPPFPVIPVPDIPCMPFAVSGSDSIPALSKDISPQLRSAFSKKPDACAFSLSCALQLPFMPVASDLQLSARFDPNLSFDPVQFAMVDNTLTLRLRLNLPEYENLPSSLTAVNIEGRCGAPFLLYRWPTGDLDQMRLRVPPWKIEVENVFDENNAEFELYLSCVTRQEDPVVAGHLKLVLKQPHNVYDLHWVTNSVYNASSPGINNWFLTVREANGAPGNPPQQFDGNGNPVRYVHYMQLQVPHYYGPFTFPQVVQNAVPEAELQVDYLIGALPIPVRLKVPGPASPTHFDYVYGLTADTTALYCKKARAHIQYGIVWSIEVLDNQVIAPFDACT